MLYNQAIIEGTLSRKHQIIIPAAMRDAIGLRHSDKIEFRLQLHSGSCAHLGEILSVIPELA